MFHKLSLVAVALALVIGWWPAGVWAAQSKANSVLPEVDGIYTVPGRPDLRLRVIVHHGKPDAVSSARSNRKPAPTPTVQCSSTSTADPDSSSVDHATGWTLPATWTYRVNSSSIPGTIGTTNGLALVGKSVATWQEQLTGNVAFINGGGTSLARAQRDGQNIITWGRTSGNALAVTYTWYSTLTGEAAEIDTLFNKGFTWYWSNPGTWPSDQTCAYTSVYDAQNILTHELGHTVGLDDEYAAGYVNNTMYGYGSTGETKKDTLTLGEAAAVNTLYYP